MKKVIIPIIFYIFCFSELTLSKPKSQNKMLSNIMQVAYGKSSVNTKLEVKEMNKKPTTSSKDQKKIKQDKNEKISKNNKPTPNIEIATFAGGCFWCVEAVFEKVKGVKKVISGFAGGQKKHPSYKEVSRGPNQSCGSYPN